MFGDSGRTDRRLNLLKGKRIEAAHQAGRFRKLHRAAPRGKSFRRCGEKCFAGLLEGIHFGVLLIGRIIEPLFGVFIKCRIRGHSLF